MTRGIRDGRIGLAVLFAVYTLNYLDRSLIYILFKPIKAELSLGDLEIALLGSTAFVLFYTTLGVPFGRLADRLSRTKMIAAGLILWTVASTLTGLAGTFALLLACRVAVGVGEATLGPAAYSLLADWFPPNRRGTAAALFATGIPIGAGLAMIGGGWIAEAWGWRWAFPLLSLPGLVVAGLVLALAEPTRGVSSGGPTPGAREAPTAASAAPSIGAVLQSSIPLRWHIAGYATLAIAANGTSMWVPGLLAGRFDRGLAEVGLWMGTTAVTGGLVGTASAGWIADRLQDRHAGGRLLFGAALGVGTAAAWIALLVAPTVPTALAALGVSMTLSLAWLGPAAADVQDLVAPGHRGVAIAVYTMIVNIVGLGLGAPLIGAINDAIGASADPSLLPRSLVVCPIAAAVSAVLLAMGARSRTRARIMGGSVVPA